MRMKKISSSFVCSLPVVPGKPLRIKLPTLDRHSQKLSVSNRTQREIILSKTLHWKHFAAALLHIWVWNKTGLKTLTQTIVTTRVIPVPLASLVRHPTRYKWYEWPFWNGEKLQWSKNGCQGWTKDKRMDIKRTSWRDEDQGTSASWLCIWLSSCSK